MYLCKLMFYTSQDTCKHQGWQHTSVILAFVGRTQREVPEIIELQIGRWRKVEEDTRHWLLMSQYLPYLCTHICTCTHTHTYTHFDMYIHPCACASTHMVTHTHFINTSRYIFKRYASLQTKKKKLRVFQGRIVFISVWKNKYFKEIYEQMFKNILKCLN